MKTTVEAESSSDAKLVQRCRGGDRDAFARIVERYQSVVCALTYAACGNLQTSEDLAQVTFITAWCELPKLQEPSRLKSWLCGIARNVTNNSFRQGQRSPTARAEELDTNLTDDAPSPAEHAITKEEEAILWRALGKLPATYREPLVLFYRQYQSATEVAEVLGLSEEAVHQRLSRGRRLLTDEVAAFVEGTLERTTPGKAFTLDVLAALPLAAASTGAAGVSAAAKGTAATKSAGLLAWLLPLAGIIGGITAQWLIVRASPTPRERRLKILYSVVLWTFILGMLFAARPVLRVLSDRFQWSDRTFLEVMAGFWWFYAAVPVSVMVIVFRRVFAIRQQALAAGGRSQAVPTLSKSRRIVFLSGLYLACFSWMIGLAVQAGDRVSAGILTAAMVLLGVLNFYQVGSRIGISALRWTIGHLALNFSVMLLVLNWRLDVWLAVRRGIELSEMHSLLPMWVVHLATLALVLWVAVLVVITRPKRTA